jgi:hypothetical protein
MFSTTHFPSACFVFPVLHLGHFCACVGIIVT